MKKRNLLVLTAALFATPLFAAEPALAVPPMKYGRIDATTYPQPPTINQSPVAVRSGGDSTPVYLHVPTAATKKWDKYCERYDACDRPVYFVQDDWFKKVYTPAYDKAHPRSATESMDKSDRPRDERGTDIDRGKGNLLRGPGDKATKPPTTRAD